MTNKNSKKLKAKHIRLAKLFAALALLATSISLILFSFQDNLIFFYSPTQLEEENNPKKIFNKKIRVGGLVKKGTVNSEKDQHKFTISDNKNDVAIKYKGILPPMFREEQGIVAEGILSEDRVFTAEKLVTKHDENYMPPEVKKTIIEAGHPEGK